jgi:membrane protease YdiL (CAAX protease family)
MQGRSVTYEVSHPPPIQAENRSITAFAGVGRALGLIGWYFLFGAPLAFISLGIKDSHPHLGDFVGFLSMIFVVIGSLWLARSAWGAGWRRTLPLSSVSQGVLLWTAMCIFALFPVMLALMSIMWRIVGSFDFTITSNSNGWLTLVVGAPLSEEVLMRGYGLTRIREQCGERRALLLTSVVFAMCHISLVRLPDTFITGIFFGWLVIQTNSLWPSLLGHFTFNICAAVLEYTCAFDPNQATWTLIIILGVTGLAVLAILWAPQVRGRIEELKILV